jgi:arylformamidase
MESMPKILDISLPLYPGMITYPNNPNIEIKSLKTPTTFISEIKMGTHSGTHIDVPRHIKEDGLTLDQINLDILMGTCRVLDVTNAETSIKIKDIKKYNIQKGERILFKTGNSLRDFNEFYEDYIFLDGEAADYLVEKQIILAGIDSLSIKQRGSPDQRPHTSLLNNNVVILEGLDLSKAEEGEYELICLPLRLLGLDGSPVRAILTK